ncbi:MAG: exodeoxyribonuclease VII small subunit [Prochlorococcaceae cyanobacterium]
MARRSASPSPQDSASPSPQDSASPSPGDSAPPQPPAGGDGAHLETPEEEDSIAADLSYQQARTALELVLAELQTTELEVEQMADLYRRGLQYLGRCEAVLERVEQEVLLWQAGDARQEPEPLPPG